MNLGCSTNAYTEKSLIYAIKSIAAIGYDGIEIVLDIPHAYLPIKKSNLEIIKNEIRKVNLKITNLNANTVSGWYKENSMVEKFEPSLSNDNEKLRHWRINYTKQAIDLAVEISSPSISITAGIANDNIEKRICNFKNSLQKILEYAEKKDVLIAIEYEPGLLLGNYNETFSLISKECKNLGLNLDVCHAAVLNENIPLIIKKTNKKLFHTHISDCKNRIHYHLIPGLGDIDFESMYDELRQINYGGFLTVELYTYSKIPEEATKNALTYLKRLEN